MASRLVGDWEKAVTKLNLICDKTKLTAVYKAILYESGELVLDRLIEHIDSQDLNWTPLSDATIERKGNDQIYVDSGEFKESLTIRNVKSGSGYSIIIGASPWKTHKGSGLKMSDLMVFLEYGTSTIPPRPLLRPTLEEVKPEIEKMWKKEIKKALLEVR